MKPLDPDKLDFIAANLKKMMKDTKFFREELGRGGNYGRKPHDVDRLRRIEMLLQFTYESIEERAKN